eukprot:3944108-Prymnesium_polylepis.1
MSSDRRWPPLTAAAVAAGAAAVAVAATAAKVYQLVRTQPSREDAASLPDMMSANAVSGESTSTAVASSELSLKHSSHEDTASVPDESLARVSGEFTTRIAVSSRWMPPAVTSQLRVSAQLQRDYVASSRCVAGEDQLEVATAAIPRGYIWQQQAFESRFGDALLPPEPARAW